MTRHSWLFFVVWMLADISASAQMTLHSDRSTLTLEHQPVAPPPASDWVGDTDVIDLVIRPSSSGGNPLGITLSSFSYGYSDGPITLVDTHRGAHAYSGAPSSR